jgi:hypothetical protein
MKPTTVFKVHEVLAQRAALQAQAGVVAFLQQLQADTEAFVGDLGAGDRLEHQVQRYPTLDGGDR